MAKVRSETKFAPPRMVASTSTSLPPESQPKFDLTKIKEFNTAKSKSIKTSKKKSKQSSAEHKVVPIDSQVIIVKYEGQPSKSDLILRLIKVDIDNTGSPKWFAAAPDITKCQYPLIDNYRSITLQRAGCVMRNKINFVNNGGQAKQPLDEKNIFAFSRYMFDKERKWFPNMKAFLAQLMEVDSSGQFTGKWHAKLDKHEIPIITLPIHFQPAGNRKTGGLGHKKAGGTLKRESNRKANQQKVYSTAYALLQLSSVSKLAAAPVDLGLASMDFSRISSPKNTSEKKISADEERKITASMAKSSTSQSSIPVARRKPKLIPARPLSELGLLQHATASILGKRRFQGDDDREQEQKKQHKL